MWLTYNVDVLRNRQPRFIWQILHFFIDVWNTIATLPMTVWIRDVGYCVCIEQLIWHSVISCDLPWNVGIDSIDCWIKISMLFGVNWSQTLMAKFCKMVGSYHYKPFVVYWFDIYQGFSYTFCALISKIWYLYQQSVRLFNRCCMVGRGEIWRHVFPFMGETNIINWFIQKRR